MNEYTKQAKGFLDKVGAQVAMQQIRPELAFRPSWAKEGEINHGFEYRVAIIRQDGRDYRFTFWDSIANAQANKRPTVYDILACLNPVHSETFDDFCDEFGYSADSREAYSNWLEVKKESDALHKLFSESELNMLGEIQ